MNTIRTRSQLFTIVSYSTRGQLFELEVSCLLAERLFKPSSCLQSGADNFIMCLGRPKIFENIHAKCLHESCKIKT